VSEKEERDPVSIMGLLVGIACLTPFFALASQAPDALPGAAILLGPGILGVVRGFWVPRARMRRPGVMGRVACVAGAILHTYIWVFMFWLLLVTVLMAFFCCCGTVMLVGTPLGGLAALPGFVVGALAAAYVLNRLSPRLNEASRGLGEALLGRKGRPPLTARRRQRPGIEPPGGADQGGADLGGDQEPAGDVPPAGSDPGGDEAP
jgi:hypothetical protein